MSTISELMKAQGLLARCPNCDESFPLRSANLFDATRRLPKPAIKHLQIQQSAVSDELERIKREKAELKRRSYTSAETSGVGQIVEMLSPSLPGFPLAPADCRALLKPIDYVGFKGLSASGKVDAVVFIEIKSGRQQLSREQRQIRTTVEQGGVRLVVADHMLAAQ